MMVEGKKKITKKERELRKIAKRFGGKIKKEEIPNQLQNVKFRFLRLQKKEDMNLIFGFILLLFL